MRLWSGILLFSVILLGCSGQFSSRLVNFNAYYNTFYNAQLNYSQGYTKSIEQSRRYNVLQPIRVYETPMGAGMQEFQSAIDKGADILRKHKESKWVDNALELIGKSYFFRTEYFSADQKFDELLLTTSDPELLQKAVFWKGRVFMELELFTQGVQYLEEQRSLYDDQWIGDIGHQINVILAELYIARENYEAAIPLLSTSASQLPGRALKERAFFLLGQLNDFQGYTEAAFEAYDAVAAYYFNYDLQFEAQKKKADVARQLGRADEAYEVFYSMIRDDKNTEFVAELQWELGMTEVQRNRPDEAERIFLSLLRDVQYPPEPRTKALTYYGLAEIYRFNQNNYTLAAAYYDSSSRINVPEESLPEYYNADELSVSFGEYARLQEAIQREDSLLYLGKLSPAKFDSVIQVIQAQREAEQQRLEQERQDQQNTLVTIDRQGGNQTTASNNGFLNELNAQVMADAQQQFNALWMGRALTDYWRFESLARRVITEDSSETIQEVNTTVDRQQQNTYSIDISDIPFSEADQDSAYERLSEYFYGLGNLFFLNLNNPDSAEYYFTRVWTERPQSKVAAVSLYSLAEIAFTENDLTRAKGFAETIIANFPNSIYARRTADRFELSLEQASEEKNPEIETFRALIAQLKDSDVAIQDSVMKWGQRALNEVLGEQAYRLAFEEYLHQTTADSAYKSRLMNWMTLQREWEEKQSNFNTRKDSIRAVLNDTLLDPEIEDQLQASLDSTLSEPIWFDSFPYTGDEWDRARVYLASYDTSFSKNIQAPYLQKLALELRQPENPYLVVADTTASDSTNLFTANLRDSTILNDSLRAENPEAFADSSERLNQLEHATMQGYTNCSDIGITPEFRGGMVAFLSRIPFPSGIVITPVTYRFYINERGIIDDFEALDDDVSPELLEAIEATLSQETSFEPSLQDGRSIRLVCDITLDPGEL